MAGPLTMASLRNPRLTVLTTVFNGARYLGQTIESVLTQDFADFEHLTRKHFHPDSPVFDLPQHAGARARVYAKYIMSRRGIAAGEQVQPS
jgi:hypothetical protein